MNIQIQYEYHGRWSVGQAIKGINVKTNRNVNSSTAY